MDRERFAEHLEHPQRRGVTPAGAHTGAAGGAACGDLVRVSLLVRDDHVVDAGFDASGCGAAIAAGSAAMALVHGAAVLDAARVSSAAIADELGGLSPGKLHSADLAADALHGALGAAARASAAVPASAQRTLVAMSGGVDSAVAALLVARAGREAVGVTVELWRDPDNDAESSCCSASAVRGARALAHRLGLPHLTLDLRDEFRAGVVDPWVAEHAAGSTPNPCIGCNGHVRLDAMLQLADRLGAADLATGHYARRTHDGLLRAAADAAKDQSYMLAAVGDATLARLRFPLGELDKPSVRALAAEAGLPVASRVDSQDLCFLAGTGRSAFLAKHGALRAGSGDLVDRHGRVVGRHRGHHEYTVGQRRGIGVAAAEPLYVLDKDPQANTVTVGSREDLQTTRVRVRGAILRRPAGEVEAVKLRYRSRALPCRVVGELAAGAHAVIELDLDEPVEGAAHGQAAVLLRGDAIVGHGTIARAAAYPPGG